MSNQEQKPSFKATTYPNGTKEHYTFNESKALASLHTAKRDYTYQRDALGRIVALTNEEGKEVENITYDGHYGKILKHSKEEETLNPYGYTGRETDQEDLYYYRARYYDPMTQRFLSRDPIEFEAGDFNFYRYVGGDPVNFRDPSGHAGVGILQNIKDALDFKDALDTLGDVFDGITLNSFKKCRSDVMAKYPTNVDESMITTITRQKELTLCEAEHVHGFSKEGLQVLDEGLGKFEDLAKEDAEEAKESQKHKVPQNNEVRSSTNQTSETSLGECDGLQDVGIDQSSTNSEIIQANENFRDCAIKKG